jgi:hypothetical protein
MTESKGFTFTRPRQKMGLVSIFFRALLQQPYFEALFSLHLTMQANGSFQKKISATI